MSKKKEQSLRKKIVKTVISVVLIVGMIIGMYYANTLMIDNNRMVDNMTGANVKKINTNGVDASAYDLEYYKSDYESSEELAQAEDALDEQIASEGMVLLKNDGLLPLVNTDTPLSFFSVNSNTVMTKAGVMGGGSGNLKEECEESGLKVNDTLWDFYSGKTSDYGLGSGSVSFGDDEDFSINEVPLAEITADSGVVDSLQGTLPVYVLKRVAGEGRDMPRSMYNHANTPEDQQKSYIEPDSTELEILTYLNDHFDNILLVVNTNAAIELDWLSEFPHITAVLEAPSGLNQFAEIITGEENPSGRTVDTYVADASKSPAAQNFGDYQYYDEEGNATKYNYVTYQEGIYVGYRYYETRYEDVVMNTSNVGEYDYASEVCFPFGYGLSYTTFEWSNQAVNWNQDVCTLTVDVTNTGAVAGKDVVEVYAQSPYTDYDRANGVEKPSVELMGYAKTNKLEPGETQTVEVTFNKSQLKAYDYSGAKTYIFDAGTYYITAAKNAHEAVNNILTKKGFDETTGMTAAGNADFVAEYVPENTETDVTTYAKDDYSGKEITNQLDFAAGDATYLTRSDWNGTFPTNDGEVSDVISTWGNEINGTDKDGNPASYVYYKEISEDEIAALDSFDSLNDEDTSSFTEKPVYGKNNGLTLIDVRGLEYDDPLWDDLLDELDADDYYYTIGRSGYGIEGISSVDMPFAMDADTANGLIYGGTGKYYPNSMTLAQTWNQELAKEYGTMIGNEALEGGMNGWYAPSMNIHRTPYSGRNGEYFSEDPFLSGAVASNEILGCASKGVYAYIKHFAFNDQENHRGDRDGQYAIATWLNEQAAREIYLEPFELCMKAGNVEETYLADNGDGTYTEQTREIRACQAIMTAFNRVGNVWTGGCYPLITGIVRNEWDFDGLIITDNANTGVFMDGVQMIEAGADIKLTSADDSMRFDWDKNDLVQYHYAREVMHRTLYTIANSNAMQGMMHGMSFEHKVTTTEIVQKVVNIAFPILIVLLVLMTVLRFIPRKKKETM
ncbi:MAG: glycoside hydrolase family 3 C-terminal domain-containing protein [Lachnospiraceae bacterium]|nr:glycoside hydrolase family 3 C-terminal domain-containing protein [Lachnospiraceae bacterium]